MLRRIEQRKISNIYIYVINITLFSIYISKVSKIYHIYYLELDYLP